MLQAPPPESDASEDFSVLVVHELAAAQPTAYGKVLRDLEVFDGRLYAGYGDFGANTGPIVVVSVDLASEELVEEFTADSEATFNLRLIGDRLVIPSMDPRVGDDYSDGPPWAGHSVVGAHHIYDAASFTGDDLWLVGSVGTSGVAWRSTDGVEWAEVRRYEPIYLGQFDAARFGFAAVYEGQLWLQGFGTMTGPSDHSEVFDGAIWTEGPPIIPQEAPGPGWQPVAWGVRLVIRDTGQGDASTVYVFDGANSVSLGTGYDVSVVGERLYVLRIDGRVQWTLDGVVWVDVAVAPATSRSMVVHDGIIYVGTTQSTIQSAPI